MKIINKTVSLDELWRSKETEFTEVMKIVVDIKKHIMAIDAEMHVDLEQLLLNDGSDQKDLWGANIYPQRSGDDFIEYTALINIRPGQDNRNIIVQNEDIRLKIKQIIKELLQR
jgi:hypothetical protein